MANPLHPMFRSQGTDKPVHLCPRCGARWVQSAQGPWAGEWNLWEGFCPEDHYWAVDLLSGKALAPFGYRVDHLTFTPKLDLEPPCVVPGDGLSKWDCPPDVKATRPSPEQTLGAKMERAQQNEQAKWIKELLLQQQKAGLTGPQNAYSYAQSANQPASQNVRSYNNLNPVAADMYAEQQRQILMEQARLRRRELESMAYEQLRPQTQHQSELFKKLAGLDYQGLPKPPVP